MGKIMIKTVAEANGLDLNKLYPVIYKSSVIKTYGSTDNMIEENDVELAVKLYKAEYSEEAQQKKQEIEKSRTDNLVNMVLSSCQTVDGYRASEQLGLVFGECVFKSGFLKRLSASFDNLGDMLSLSETELTGSARLLEEARNYAISKMKNEAVQRGANAIIGIDAETSVGGDFIHVTIFGTAVKLEKIEG